jgi:hypothetical protein
MAFNTSPALQILSCPEVQAELMRRDKYNCRFLNVCIRKADNRMRGLIPIQYVSGWA